MNLCLIYITIKDSKEAEQIGKTLLQEKLASCVNIIPNMKSMYWWEGEIKQENEAILLVKTKKELFEKIEQKVQELHSYDCPCVISLPIENGSAAYLKWLDAN